MAKSILEEALLQVSQLEEAVKKNAKEILASTMKQEIDELVRESMEEPQIDEEAEEASEMMETAEEVSADAELEEQFEGSEEDEDESEESDEEGEEGEEMTEPETEIEGEDELDMDDIEMPTLDLPSLDGEEDEDEVIDMTGASDEEILKVFKAMGDEDGIIVSQDDDGTVHLEDGDDEYRIEMNESEEAEEADEEGSEEEVSESMDEELAEESDEEVVYEIEIDDEEEVMESEESEIPAVEVEESEESEDEMMESEDMEGEEEAPEADMEEAARTHAADARVPSNQGKKYKAGRADLSEDVDTLKAKNQELTEALKVFRDKLNEVGVFNANLAYATRLFTENTTTKQEKLNILKRFDSVESLKESKALYNTIKNELTASDNKLTETVVNKITSSPQTGSSEKLVESKTYENPQIRRIKEMMGIVK